MPSSGDKNKDAEAADLKPASVPSDNGTTPKDDAAAQLTCDVLCSLSGGSSSPPVGGVDDAPCQEAAICEQKAKKSGGKASCKSPQLPMFLSKTYHMIDRCDPDIATWSDTGDNFVVKNVEKFAATVLPQYFKHSNFSSFCRQLNFYGFRKLKAEPILTADFDARTACYVRFYHEKFQKDRPELLKDIRRATKSDMQSRDDVESLKTEVSKLKEVVNTITTDYDRKLAEMSYEYNRRITSLQAEYDRLAMIMQQILAKPGEPAVLPPGSVSVPFAASGVGPDLHSLTHAASRLQNGTLVPPPPPPAASAGDKRPSASEVPAAAPPKKRATTGE